MKNTDIKYYDINWLKVKTIKDMKSIMKVLINKLQIDHNDQEDIEVYAALKHLLDEGTNENVG